MGGGQRRHHLGVLRVVDAAREAGRQVGLQVVELPGGDRSRPRPRRHAARPRRSPARPAPRAWRPRRGRPWPRTRWPRPPARRRGRSTTARRAGRVRARGPVPCRRRADCPRPRRWYRRPPGRGPRGRRPGPPEPRRGRLPRPPFRLRRPRHRRSVAWSRQYYVTCFLFGQGHLGSVTPHPKPEKDCRRRCLTVAKGRKNGLYQGVSAELSALMRTGWADTEKRDLQPNEQTPYAARRRAALSARFPGERLVIPSGSLKTRSNDTPYPFRPYSGYVHLTGDQARDGALVLEPRADGGHDAHCYQLPRDTRDSDEFWTGKTAELWMGRRRSLAESERVLGLPCRDIRTIAEDLKDTGVPTRLVRGHNAVLDAALTHGRRAGRRVRGGGVRAAAGQGRVGDRRDAPGRGRHGPRIHRCRTGVVAGGRHLRAVDRGHLLPPRPRRGQRRRLRLHLRRRRARHDHALDGQRRPGPPGRTPPARRGRGDPHPLHRRRHAHPPRRRHVHRRSSARSTTRCTRPRRPASPP